MCESDAIAIKAHPFYHTTHGAEPTLGSRLWRYGTRRTPSSAASTGGCWSCADSSRRCCPRSPTAPSTSPTSTQSTPSVPYLQSLKPSVGSSRWVGTRYTLERPEMSPPRKPLSSAMEERRTHARTHARTPARTHTHRPPLILGLASSMPWASWPGDVAMCEGLPPAPRPASCVWRRPPSPYPALGALLQPRPRVHEPRDARLGPRLRPLLQRLLRRQRPLLPPLAHCVGRRLVALAFRPAAAKEVAGTARHSALGPALR